MTALPKSIVAGRFELRELIGEGATGLVMEGWDRLLRRPVAIKHFILRSANNSTESQVFHHFDDVMSVREVQVRIPAAVHLTLFSGPCPPP